MVCGGVTMHLGIQVNTNNASFSETGSCYVNVNPWGILQPHSMDALNTSSGVNCSLATALQLGSRVADATQLLYACMQA